MRRCGRKAAVVFARRVSAPAGVCARAPLVCGARAIKGRVAAPPATNARRALAGGAEALCVVQRARTSHPSPHRRVAAFRASLSAAGRNPTCSPSPTSARRCGAARLRGAGRRRARFFVARARAFSDVALLSQTRNRRRAAGGSSSAPFGAPTTTRPRLTSTPSRPSARGPAASEAPSRTSSLPLAQAKRAGQWLDFQ